MRTLLSFLVKGYQRMVSPWLPPTCRYVPTCSQYFLDALEAHGAVRGTWLGVKRILRCHPLGGYGVDPVAPAGRVLREKKAGGHG
jgi:putative membrane protein insertion efficiency factor